MINKVQTTGYQRGRARLIAGMILREPRISAVALGSVQSSAPVTEVQRRVAAIVLAGGLSSRMGQSKVLMSWDGRPIIQTIVDRLKRMRLDEIVVVTAHTARQGNEALAAPPAPPPHK